MKNVLYITFKFLYLLIGFIVITLYSNTESFLGEIKEADAFIRYDSTLYEVNKDGTYTTTYHERIKILSQHGMEIFGQKSFPFSETSGTIAVIFVKVYKPNGKIVDVSSENIETLRMPAWEGAKFFVPNIYFLKITFPQLEIGGEIEYKVRDIYRGSAIENHFERYAVFEDTEPIGEKVIIVDVPQKMDLKWILIESKTFHKDNKIFFNKEIKGNRLINRWAMEGICPIEMEPAMPNINNLAAKLLISTLPSWEFLSKWYYEISEPTFKTNIDMRFLITNLIDEEMTKEEKIRVCFNWVVENIRYVETTLTGPKAGLRPAPAPETFNREYGVCRDMAALLISLLNEAGIESSIALTNPIMKVEEKLPVDQFNHTIVAVKSDTNYFYLDPTPDNSKEFLPAYEYNGRAVLICTKEGDSLRHTPREKPEKNSLKITVKSNLNSNNELTGVLTFETRGYMDLKYRNMLRKNTPEKTKEVMADLVKIISPSGMVDTFYIKGLESLKEDLLISVRYRAKNYGNKMGEIISLHSPIRNSWETDKFFRGINAFALEERKYPVDLGITSNISYHEEITLANIFKIEALPENYEFSNEYIYTKQSYKTNKNKLKIDSKFIVKTPEIPINKYKEIKKIQSKADELARQKIIIKRR
jgi:transglutaminase-like putative cysteine protease